MCIRDSAQDIALDVGVALLESKLFDDLVGKVATQPVVKLFVVRVSRPSVRLDHDHKSSRFFLEQPDVISSSLGQMTRHCCLEDVAHAVDGVVISLDTAVVDDVSCFNRSAARKVQ